MDVIKIFVTTDNHLGFMERDPNRGDDSFVTFEECLQIALEAKADFALLGGDFFHDHKPSLKVLMRTTGLLRKYVMGNRPVEFDVVSDGRINFPTHPVPCANFQDPNYNVALPIFMIHGNHDDAIGGASPIDVLSSSGLVNYFGHTEDVDQIEIHPILIVKGTTKVALYGLGYVRDERLHRCFTLGKVSLRLPSEDPEGWFRILVVHQNRGIRNPTGKAGLYDEMLAGMADLVIWGNEHEQVILPHEVAATRGMDTRGFDIIQPGSTVHTSICSEECNPKMCCVVEVHHRSMRVTAHTLRSVRPILQRTIELRKEAGLEKKAEAVEEFLRSVVESMAQECDGMVKAIPDRVLHVHPNLKLPLLRLNVDSSDVPGQSSFPIVNASRFGQHFVEITANASDILRNLKLKGSGVHHHVRPGVAAEDADETTIRTDNAQVRIQDLMQVSTRDVCTMLSENVLGTAVLDFAEKGEKGAIDDAIQQLLDDCQKNIWQAVRAEIGPGRTVDMDAPKVSSRARERKTIVNREHRPGVDQVEVVDNDRVGLPSPALPHPGPEPGAAVVPAFADADDDVVAVEAPQARAGRKAPAKPPSKRAPPKTASKSVPPPPLPPKADVTLKWKREREE